MDSAELNHLQEQISQLARSRFPDPAVRQVTLLQYGDEPAIEPGEVLVRLVIEPPGSQRPDGTEADFFTVKSALPGMTKAMMHRVGGMLAVLAGRVNRQIFVSVAAYQPGGPNSDADVQRDLAAVLSDFSLTGRIGFSRPEPAGEHNAQNRGIVVKFDYR